MSSLCTWLAEQLAALLGQDGSYEDLALYIAELETPEEAADFLKDFAGTTPQGSALIAEYIERRFGGSSKAAEEPTTRNTETEKSLTRAGSSVRSLEGLDEQGPGRSGSGQIYIPSGFTAYKKKDIADDYFSGTVSQVEEKRLPPENTAKESAADRRRSQRSLGNGYFELDVGVNDGVSNREGVYEKGEKGRNESAKRKAKTAKPRKIVLHESEMSYDVLLPGRNRCECEAQRHALVGNCSDCGRIVCEQEGAGPCMFCGSLVNMTSEEFEEQAQVRPEILRVLQQRDRLLYQDRYSVSQTKVIDDQSDFYVSSSKSANGDSHAGGGKSAGRDTVALLRVLQEELDANTWISAAERAEQQSQLSERMQRAMEEEKRARGGAVQLTVDFGGHIAIAREGRERESEDGRGGDVVEAQFSVGRRKGEKEKESSGKTDAVEVADRATVVESELPQLSNGCIVPHSQISATGTNTVAGGHGHHAFAQETGELPRALRPVYVAASPDVHHTTQKPGNSSSRRSDSGSGGGKTTKPKMSAGVHMSTVSKKRVQSDYYADESAGFEDDGVQEVWEVDHDGDKGFCLSMHQPWASLLVRGIKRHEGRTWTSEHRGRLWIASTSQIPDDTTIASVEQQYKDLGRIDDAFTDRYPQSALLGCLDVVDIMDRERYLETFGGTNAEESSCPHVFICENPMRLQQPMHILGRPKIWPLPRSIWPHIQRALVAPDLYECVGASEQH